MSSSFANLGPIFMKNLLNCSASSFLSVICFSLILQGSTLAVFRYPEPPRFPDGIPDSPEQ